MEKILGMGGGFFLGGITFHGGDPSVGMIQFTAGAASENRSIRLDGLNRQQELTFMFRPDTAGIYNVSAEIAASMQEVATSTRPWAVHRTSGC